MARIIINGVIGPWPWGDVSSQEVIEQLDAIPDGEEIVAEIHSPGGVVSEGKSIYHSLLKRGGDVTAEVIMAGSAASWIAMAADKVTVFDYSEFFVHNSSVGVYAFGNKTDISKLSDDLDKLAIEMGKLDVQMAEMYASRSGTDVKDVSKLMDDETTLFGKEILDKGFASDYVATKQRPENLRQFDLRQVGYRNCDKSKFHNDRATRPIAKPFKVVDTNPEDEAADPERDNVIAEAEIALSECV